MFNHVCLSFSIFFLYYHVDVSGVVYPTGSVLSVEKVSNVLLPSLANGFDGRGSHTIQALKYLTKRFGSISSFTGTYKADRFTMNIGRSAQHPGKYNFIKYQEWSSLLSYSPPPPPHPTHPTPFKSSSWEVHLLSPVIAHARHFYLEIVILS